MLTSYNAAWLADMTRLRLEVMLSGKTLILLRDEIEKRGLPNFY